MARCSCGGWQRNVFLVLVLVFVISGGELLALQEQSGPASNNQTTQPTTVLKTTTRLVVVDVIATDRKGSAVTDLGQDDFTVLENGAAEKVRVFSFQQPAPSTAAESKPVKAPLPPNVFGNIRRTPLKGPLNVLLIDGLNTRMNNQEYVRSQLLEFLKKLPSDQPLAVYLLGSRLRLLQDFTSDPAVLRSLIENLNAPHSPLMENAFGGPERFWLEGMPLPADIKRRVLEFQQDTESSQMDHRVAITIAALRTLARTLAGFPGRKNLIWVSENIPIAILPNKVPDGEKAVGAMRNYGQAVADIANLLADAHIAVYPIDARALVNSYFSDPAVRFDPRGNGVTPGQAEADLADELQPVHANMEQIAEDTGGRATYNRNDIGNAIRRSMDDGSTYYTLAYYPQNKSWDGRFRKISVKVNRPGVKLRYRLGYFATDPKDYGQRNESQRDAEFSATLNHDVPAATELGFEAMVLAPGARTNNKAVVVFAIDPRALSFAKGTDGTQSARVQCAVRVFAATSPDKAIKTEAEHVDADLPPDSYSKVMQTGLPCRTNLELPPGDYLLRLGVRDLQTGLIGTANGRLTIAKETPESASTAERKQ